MEESTKTLAESLSVVKVQRVQLKRYLDMDRVMDALKSASTMLSELRTSSLTPKHYYELYMAVFDALRHLSIYLYDAHTGGKHHLADLYELVQYCGTIVPRLYLMITVGSVYMSVPDAPVKEIMKDMTEMSRGVQHPTRGLFLRHYLSGTTRDHLPIGTDAGPAGNLSDSISFILANFVEMNKLWVRQQHLGHSREREKREMERRELRILVGTNLVRLSQLDGVTLEMYQTTILPALLEQVIHCKDVIAQEYLMEVIIQVFPDDFHLRTLNLLLSACTRLHPKVSIKQLVISLINRLAAYATREAENESADARAREEYEANERLAAKVRDMRRHVVSKPPSAIWREIVLEQNTKRDTWRLLSSDLEQALPDDGNNIWSDTFKPPSSSQEDDAWIDGEIAASEAPKEASAEPEHALDEEPSQSPDVGGAESDKPQREQDQAASAPAKFRGIPEDVRLFEVFWEQIMLLMRARPDLSTHDISSLLLALLTLSLSCYPDRLEYVDQVLGFAKDKFTEALDAGENTVLSPQSNFHALLLAPINSYASALTLLGLPQFHALWMMQPPITQRLIAQAIVLSMLRRQTIVSSPSDVDGLLELCAPLLQNQPELTVQGIVPGSASAQTVSQANNAVLDEIANQQGALARLVHLFRSEDPDTQLALLYTVRQRYVQGGDAIRSTIPPLIMDSIALVRRFELSSRDKNWERKMKTLFRFVHQLISTLYHSVESPELCLRFFLLAAEVADEAGFEELAYDFYVQSFTIFEESVSDSRSQHQAIGLITSTLYKARAFSRDNYDTLATRAALYSAKLLKRPQQALAVLMASHLWWQLPASKDRGIELRHPLVKSGRRVLECLQKALRIADGCMDEHATIDMFCHALNKYIYYFEVGVDTVSSRHINSLVNLIAKALDTINSDNKPMSWRQVSVDIPANSDAAQLHFVNLLRYVESKKQAALDAETGSLAGPDWLGLQTTAILTRLAST